MNEIYLGSSVTRRRLISRSGALTFENGVDKEAHISSDTELDSYGTDKKIQHDGHYLGAYVGGDEAKDPIAGLDVLLVADQALNDLEEEFFKGATAGRSHQIGNRTSIGADGHTSKKHKSMATVMEDPGMRSGQEEEGNESRETPAIGTGSKGGKTASAGVSNGVLTGAANNRCLSEIEIVSVFDPAAPPPDVFKAMTKDGKNLNFKQQSQHTQLPTGRSPPPLSQRLQPQDPIQQQPQHQQNVQVRPPKGPSPAVPQRPASRIAMTNSSINDRRAPPSVVRSIHGPNTTSTSAMSASNRVVSSNASRMNTTNTSSSSSSCSTSSNSSRSFSGHVGGAVNGIHDTVGGVGGSSGVASGSVSGTSSSASSTGRRGRPKSGRLSQHDINVRKKQQERIEREKRIRDEKEAREREKKEMG